MRVLLIAANTEQIGMLTLPLGLELVNVAMRLAGHESRVLDLIFAAGAAAVRDEIDAFNPDAIGISVRNIDDQNLSNPRFLLEPVRAVVAECRAASRVPIIVGGAGYSIFPGPALAYLGADLGVCGDGDAVISAILARLGNDVAAIDLPGVWTQGRVPARRNASVRDLDAVPLPDPASWPPSDADLGEAWMPVQTRRGCPFQCSYCSTPAIEGRRIRSRSPSRVRDWMARMRDRGFGRFYFVDNTFNLPTAYAFELCRELATLRPRVSWRCIVYPHLVSEALVTAMADAGCVEVSLGFESGSDRVLAAMGKRYRPGEVRQIAAAFAAHGVRRHGFLLLGGPEETPDSMRESLAFAASLKLDALKSTIGIRIYPDTPLARRAVERGIITVNDDLLMPTFYLEPAIRDAIGASPTRR